MTTTPQAKVLMATLVECTSAAGKPYLKGWAGASNLIGFKGEPDQEGRATWQLFLTERLPAKPRREEPPP